jgi:hypothetical protein
MAIKKSLDTLKTEINRNFVIRLKPDNQKKTDLVGVETFRLLFPTKAKADIELRKALNSNVQNPHLKLRRGLLITYHRK